MNLRPLPVLLASFALSACVGTLDGGPLGDDQGGGSGGGDESGGGGGGGGGGEDVAAADAAPEPQDYLLTVDTALGEIELGQEFVFTATVASDNFEGPVSLSLVGALPTWEISYSPSETINLLKDETQDIVVTVAVPTNGDAGLAALTFNVDGELGARSVTGNLDVANQVTIVIPAGTGAGGAHMGGTYLVRTGTDVVILNEDATTHRIHADPHQDENLPTGATYVLNYNSGGNQAAYCHIHGENTGVALFAVE